MSDHKPDSEESTSEITGKALELTSQSTLSCCYEYKSEQLIRKKVNTNKMLEKLFSDSDF